MHSSHYTEGFYKRGGPSLLTRANDCEPVDPQDTITDRLNTLLNSSGPGYVLKLCPNTQYPTQAPILFAASNQEISTVGYPTGNDRATILVNGSTASDGTGHTTAIDGTCQNCSGVVLRNVQIDGNRAGAPPINGGANIEMGGSNSNQLVEYVHSHDPRSWSCLHIAEGALDCNNATVQNNDIGPCGSDAFQQWADGISMSCANSSVRNNQINNPTDGGVVLFGAPGTRVENNTIWVETHTLLGGINMVDYLPWGGNYTDTIVTNNFISGGFSTSKPTPGAKDGPNANDVIIKIGIAIGPRTWFGDQFGSNVSANGTVTNNQFSGAFSYAMAMSSALNFRIENNTLLGNTSFIGAVGPNCTQDDPVPPPAAFVIDNSNVQASTTQSDFQNIQDGDNLVCVTPPDGGDYWPFGGKPGGSAPPTSPTPKSSAGKKAGIALGVIFGVFFVAAIAWFIRRWALKRLQHGASNISRRQSSYARNMEQI